MRTRLPRRTRPSTSASPSRSTAQGWPYVDDDGTAADWLIQAALEHLLGRMRAEEVAGDIEVTTNEPEDE